MKGRVLFVLVGVIALLTGCSDDEAPVSYPNDGNLAVTARLYSNVNNYAFQNGDKIGLFVTDNENGAWYDTNPYANVMALAQGVGSVRWILDESVALSDRPALVFAYKPYDANVRSPYTIPVVIDRVDYMVDLMYGSNRQTQKVTRSEPVADLVMNHALAMIQFDLSIDTEQPYYGTGIIQEAKIVGWDREKKELIQNKHLIQEGYLDCINGYITGTAWGSIRIKDLQGKDFHGNFSGQYPAVLVAPTYRMKDTAFMINVDGLEFYIPIPDGTTWAKNTKNRYCVTLSGMDMRIDYDSMVVEEWVDGPTDSFEFAD